MIHVKLWQTNIPVRRHESFKCPRILIWFSMVCLHLPFRINNTRDHFSLDQLESHLIFWVVSPSSVSFLGRTIQGTSLAWFSWSRMSLAFSMTSLLLFNIRWAAESIMNWVKIIMITHTDIIQRLKQLNNNNSVLTRGYIGQANLVWFLKRLFSENIKIKNLIFQSNLTTDHYIYMFVNFACTVFGQKKLAK